ncbi:MAG TPA: metalloregulator ArsR/SmtB family transcription factor [Longimicrobium sp.]|nr:metalloregulator ArsR/SmtB family transcription factor [Longimicrobium sp.]
MAKLFRALSDEKRLRIVELLRGGERCVCDLQEAIDAGQSLLSFHLKTLKEAGIVDDRREGRWAFYSLNAEAFAEVEGFVAGVRQDAESSGGSKCCG